MCFFHLCQLQFIWHLLIVNTAQCASTQQTWQLQYPVCWFPCYSAVAAVQAILRVAACVQAARECLSFCKQCTELVTLAQLPTVSARPAAGVILQHVCRPPPSQVNLIDQWPPAHRQSHSVPGHSPQLDQWFGTLCCLSCTTDPFHSTVSDIYWRTVYRIGFLVATFAFVMIPCYLASWNIHLLCLHQQ